MRFAKLLPHLHSPHWLDAVWHTMHRGASAIEHAVEAVPRAAAHTIGGLGNVVGGLERRALNGIRVVEHDIGAGEHALTHAITGGARWVSHEVVGVGQAIGGVASTVSGDVSGAWHTLENVGSSVGAVLPGAIRTTTVLLPVLLAGCV